MKAARKYNRVVQDGAISRSALATQEGMKMLHDGFLGEIYMSRGLCCKWRDGFGRAKICSLGILGCPTSPPGTCDVPTTF